MSRFILTTILVMLTTSLAWAQTPLRSAKPDTNDPLTTWNLGHVELATAMSKTRDDARALAVRAHAALYAGNLKSAKTFAEKAVAASNSDSDRSGAVAVLAKVLDREGKHKDAEALLRKQLGATPTAHDVRLALGRMLIEAGRKNEAELLLDAFSGFYNNNLLKTSHELNILAQAMHLLGSFQDANHAFEEAVDLDRDNVAALTNWGFLLLEKYNTADAGRSFEDALKVRSEHPMALIGAARTEMELSTNFTLMRDQLQRAENVAPGIPLLWLTRAELAINDSDCETARQHAEKVLTLNTDDLGALTIQAACHYLDDDLKKFEATVKRVLSINKNYTPVLTETAKYAVRVHRYDEAVELNRRALKIKESDGTALLQLGIGLSRIGKEDEAQDTLKLAADYDPYNVRAFNMIQLYEEVMPEYEFTEYDGFRIRAHRPENEMVNALMAPVVKKTMRSFDQKYAMDTHPYLAVEVYPSPQTFGVRSVGLPHVSPHGICFGKVVTTRSPSEGNFNWRQVLIHEMAHVYHIQLSRSRVPRWFTEGLAEYETNVLDPSWIRHHDVELSRALAAGTLRGVSTLDKGFTQAKTYEEILRSYHQASLEIHYIVETYGFEQIPEMLKAWAKSKSTEQVFKTVLSTSIEAHDKGFEKWLSRRYMNFYDQLAIDMTSQTPTELEEKLRTNPDDAETLAKLAMLRASMGDVEGAEEALAQLALMGDVGPKAAFIMSYINFRMGKTRRAHELGLKVLDAGEDSYDLRIMLGDAAHALENLTEAEIHYQAATQLWKDGISAWQGLNRIAKVKKDQALEDKSMERIFELNQNDPVAARVFAARMVEKGDIKRAERAVKRWLDVAPFDTRSHELAADVALMRGDDAAAKEAWAMMNRLRPQDKKSNLMNAIKAAHDRKRTALVDELKAEAKKAGIPEQRINDALKR